MPIMKAIYPGTCVACAKAFPAGTLINYTRGKGATHAECDPEAAKAHNDAKAAVAASRATDASIDVAAPQGLGYLPFQRAGIAFAITRPHTLIADEMGLGKTVQAIGVLNATPNAKRVLIVCPASLKFNWRNELRAWDVHKRTIGVFPGCDPERVNVTIVNYEQLKKIEPLAWDVAIFDEAHYAKNEAAARSAEAHKHARAAKRILCLTGTPLDKPKEILSILQMLAPETYGVFGVKRDKLAAKFLFRYCDPQKVWARGKYHTDFSGASNLDELQERLRSTLMVRRLKSDVLTDLPAKRRQIVVLGEQSDDGIPFDESADYDQSVNALRRSAKIPFEEISAKRHEQALAKLPKALEFIRDSLTDTSDKVIIFAHHTDVIDGLREGLAHFGVVVIDGRTPTGEERQQIVSAFQNDRGIRVFIGSIGAASTGLTLTAASRVVFVELDWTPKAMNQAEDRAHRIGQRDAVLVQHLVIDGTIDAKIAKILVRKQAVANAALDTETYIEGLPEIQPGPQCTCLAAPDGSNGHASWCDFAYASSGGRFIDAEPYTKLAALPKARILTDDEITRIHEALRTLAERCDGARSKDGAGFNRFDSAYGTSLARREKLTERQALAAQKMLRKYVKQVGKV